MIGFLSSSANSEERSSNADTESATDPLLVPHRIEPTNSLTAKSSKSYPQRRKMLMRSDAICNQALEDGNPTTIDIIDYVHNNKKEKITIIVNLLSDEMLSNQHGDNNEHPIRKENESIRKNKDDVLNKYLSPDVGCVKKEDNKNIDNLLITIEAKTSYEPKNQIGNEITSEYPQVQETTEVLTQGK